MRLLHTQLIVQEHQPVDGEPAHLYDNDVVIRMQVEVHIPVETGRSTDIITPMFSVKTNST